MVTYRAILALPLVVVTTLVRHVSSEVSLDQARARVRQQATKLTDDAQHVYERTRGGAQEIYERTREGAQDVYERARDGMETARQNVQHAGENIKHTLEDNYESFLSWFMEPSTAVQLTRCFLLIAAVQFTLGFIPHYYLSHSSRSTKIGSLYAQGLAGVTILAIAMFSFVTQTTWSLQQIASLSLIVGYSTYLLLASSALRKYRSQITKDNRADVRSTPSMVMDKALFWFKQTMFIFLILSPFIITNNKYIAPKSRPAPPPYVFNSSLFGQIRIPRINWSNRFYSPFDFRNLGITNYIGVTIALAGLAFLFYENIAKRQHKETKRQLKESDDPQQRQQQQERQSQQDDGVRQRRGQQDQQHHHQQQQQQPVSGNKGAFYRGLFNLRAPAYLGELTFFLGLFINCSTALKGMEWLSIISPTLMLLLTTYSAITAKENKMQSKFKNNQLYQNFVKNTKRFLPYVF